MRLGSPMANTAEVKSSRTPEIATIRETINTPQLILGRNRGDIFGALEKLKDPEAKGSVFSWYKKAIDKDHKAIFLSTIENSDILEFSYSINAGGASREQGQFVVKVLDPTNTFEDRFFSFFSIGSKSYSDWISSYGNRSISKETDGIMITFGETDDPKKWAPTQKVDLIYVNYELGPNNVRIFTLTFAPSSGMTALGATPEEEAVTTGNLNRTYSIQRTYIDSSGVDELVVVERAPILVLNLIKDTFAKFTDVPTFLIAQKSVYEALDRLWSAACTNAVNNFMASTKGYNLRRGGAGQEFNRATEFAPIYKDLFGPLQIGETPSGVMASIPGAHGGQVRDTLDKAGWRTTGWKARDDAEEARIRERYSREETGQRRAKLADLQTAALAYMTTNDLTEWYAGIEDFIGDAGDIIVSHAPFLRSLGLHGITRTRQSGIRAQKKGKRRTPEEQRKWILGEIKKTLDQLVAEGAEDKVRAYLTEQDLKRWRKGNINNLDRADAYKRITGVDIEEVKKPIPIDSVDQYVLHLNAAYDFFQNLGFTIAEDFTPTKTSNLAGAGLSQTGDEAHQDARKQMEKMIVDIHIRLTGKTRQEMKDQALSILSKINSADTFITQVFSEIKLCELVYTKLAEKGIPPSTKEDFDRFILISTGEAYSNLSQIKESKDFKSTNDTLFAALHEAFVEFKGEIYSDVIEKTVMHTFTYGDINSDILSFNFDLRPWYAYLIANVIPTIATNGLLGRNASHTNLFGSIASYIKNTGNRDTGNIRGIVEAWYDKHEETPVPNTPIFDRLPFKDRGEIQEALLGFTREEFIDSVMEYLEANFSAIENHQYDIVDPIQKSSAIDNILAMRQRVSEVTFTGQIETLPYYKFMSPVRSLMSKININFREPDIKINDFFDSREPSKWLSGEYTIQGLSFIVSQGKVSTSFNIVKNYKLEN